MKIAVEVKTRVCYWQGTSILEAFCEPFDGILKCSEGVEAPTIHFLNYYINIVFPHPIIIEKQHDEVCRADVLFVYPTPKN
jgi:hypothetical protein